MGGSAGGVSSTYTSECGPGSSCVPGSTCKTTTLAKRVVIGDDPIGNPPFVPAATATCSPTGSMGLGAAGRRRRSAQAALQGCSAGETSCAIDGYGHSSLASICVNLSSNLEHCGFCGYDCSDIDGGTGSAMCIQGKCVLSDDAPPSLVRPNDNGRRPVAYAGTRTADLPTAQMRKERKRNTTRR